MYYNLPPGLTVDVSIVEVLGLHDAVGRELVDVAATHVRPAADTVCRDKLPSDPSKQSDSVIL